MKLNEMGSEFIIVCDLDDTLFHAEQQDVFIYKTKDGKTTKLSTDEYAEDPDKKSPKQKTVFEKDEISDDGNIYFNLEQFRDPDVVEGSLNKQKPLPQNLEIVDKYLSKGYDFAFLTARGLEDVIKRVMSKRMKYKDEKGKLHPLGSKFELDLSHAINDDRYKNVYSDLSTEERKAQILKKLCKTHSKVVFIDDDEGNLEQARALGLDNLKIIKAKK